jgi:hypothetical protein
MDFSFGAMSLFTMLLAVLSTAMLLPRDIEERTLYPILAKPVSRFEYLLGKFLGVGFMLFVATVLMTALFCVVLYYWQTRAISNLEGQVPIEKLQYAIDEIRSGTFTPTLFGGIGVIFLRALVFAALTLMVSAFASSWLFTVVSALMMIIIGHLVPVARSVWLDPLRFGMEVPWYVTGFLRFVSVAFPDMQLFNIVDDIAVGTVVHGSVFLSVLGLGAGYILVYLLVTWLFFAWKEL